MPCAGGIRFFVGKMRCREQQTSDVSDDLRIAANPAARINNKLVDTDNYISGSSGSGGPNVQVKKGSPNVQAI